MLFSISDGNDFNIDGTVAYILTSSVLERNKVYHFEYQKSGAWDADAPDAEHWENFFSIEDLSLPVGEYTITLSGGFELEQPVPGSERTESGLLVELTIIVEP